MTPDVRSLEQIDIVINPAAHRGAAVEQRDSIVAAGIRNGVEFTIHIPSDVEETRDRLRQIVDGGAERLVIAGGDGMVHAAAQHVAGSGCVLGIIGVGTGNDFVAALGLPNDVDRAVDAALSQPVAIDAIRVGDSWSTTVVTLGFSAMVNERAERMRFPRGPSRYTLATLLELPRMKTLPVTLTVDGDRHDIDASIVAIANTSMFGGGMKVAPLADPTDGELDVVVFTAASRSTLLRLLPKAFSGSHVDHESVCQFRGREIRVEGPAARVRADGEPLCDVPFTAVAAPGALLIAGAVPR